MAHYIDRHEFHREMVLCKKSGVISDKAIAFFNKLATEVSKDYIFNQDDDKKDGISTATTDCWKYWRNFKESNVVQIFFERNLVSGEKVRIKIANHKTYEFVAQAANCRGKKDFLIGETINKTLTNLVLAINGGETIKDISVDAKVAAFLDTINKKITFMDIHNCDDLSIKSEAELIPILEEPITSTKNKNKHELAFKNPPNAFNYFTSVVRRGILKALNKLYPDVHKPSNRLSISNFSQDNSRFYNI